MWADPSAPKAAPHDAGDGGDDPTRVPPPAYNFLAPYGGYAPQPQPPAYGVQPVAAPQPYPGGGGGGLPYTSGGGDPTPSGGGAGYWQPQPPAMVAPIAVAVPLMPPPPAPTLVAPGGGDAECCHSDDDDDDRSSCDSDGMPVSRRERRRRRRRAQRERERGAGGGGGRGRRPCLALPLLLAHNLLHWALVAGAVYFVVHTKDTVDPLCDINGCGLMGCDFPDAKCAVRGDVITAGISDDGFGDHSCCAHKGDVPFVTAATTTWAVALAGCVLGAVGAAVGPLLARARLRRAAARASDSVGADALHARDAAVSPLSLRLPIIGAAYAYSHLGQPQQQQQGAGSGGGIAVDGSVLLATDGGFASLDSDGGERKPRAGTVALLRVLSLTLLCDSLVRDLLLLGAGSHWLLSAEPAWANSSAAAAAASDDDATGSGSVQWRGPVAPGTWLAVGAAASLVTTLALRSWAVTSARG